MIFLLIAFDLEGTLLAAEFFPEMGKELGLEEALAQLTREAMNGSIGYEEALLKRFEMLRGQPIETVQEVCARLPLVNGAEETIDELKTRGYVPAIISGGFEVLADHVARRLGVSIVCANRLVVEEGRVEAIRSPIVTPMLKADLLVNIAGQLGADLAGTVAVGDGANDIPMLEAAGLGIAFNGKECVKERADIAIDSQDMTEIIPYILRFETHLEGDRKLSPNLVA